MGDANPAEQTTASSAGDTSVASSPASGLSINRLASFPLVASLGELPPQSRRVLALRARAARQIVAVMGRVVNSELGAADHQLVRTG